MTNTTQLMVENARPSFGSMAVSLAPSAVFLAANYWWGLVPGMVAASTVSLAASILRRARGRRIGLLLPISLAYVTLRGVAGVLTESETVFFGFGIATSALVALAVGATAFTRMPVAAHLLPLVVRYRHLTPQHDVYRRVAAQITLLWAAAELAITAWEAWHLSQASAAEFVVARSIVAWPVMFVIIFFLIFYVRFRLDRYEHHLARQAGAA